MDRSMSCTAKIFHGEAFDILSKMPDSHVNCVVTSPPYWALRDYGVAGQIGLEKSPFEYLEKMVVLFRELRRVLKPDGTCWINMGDTYCSTDKWGGSSGGKHSQAENGTFPSATCRSRKPHINNIKPKDLCGMPWRLAFALQDDGWYLRSDIIWHKTNPMPESVYDRPTKSHEYIFLLTKQRRYFYDAAAIKEPVTGNAHARGHGVNPKTWKTPDGWDTTSGTGSHGSFHRNGREKGKTPVKNSLIHIDRDPALRPKRPRQNHSFSAAVAGLVDSRNKRSVWSVACAPYRGAHFATFPPRLIEPCILAGCPADGLVLDPFAGSGTSGEVALKHGRNFVGIELNAAYVELIRLRLGSVEII
jgi:DNA modification methylase